MLCVTTRFRLRRPWSLISMYRAYRRMQRDLEVAPGLLRHAFLLQSPFVVCTLSVWASQETLDRFANVRSHVAAVRYAKRACSEIWSAYWRLDAVSGYASEWSGRAVWPALVPDPARPWRLVAPSAAEGAGHAAEPVDVVEPAGRSSSLWDWPRVRREPEAARP